MLKFLIIHLFLFKGGNYMQVGSIIGIINSVILIFVILGGISKGTKIVPKQYKPFVNNIHKFVGYYLSVAALLHAYFVLDSFRFHHGFILYFFLLIQIGLVIFAKKAKKKALFTTHKIFPVVILIMLATHVFTHID